MTTRLKKVFEQVQEPGDGLTDAQLLARFVAARDEQSFAALVRRHGPMVYAVCRRVVRDAHYAEDAFQATFLILARKAAAVVKRDSVGSYLHAIAYHTALAASHANARRRTREKPMQNVPQPEAPRADPADTATDWRPLLDRELHRLSEKCRAALVLCDLEGMPQRRAAAHLGISPSTLSSRLMRARALLAKRLTARGVTLSAGALAVVLTAESASAQVPALVESSTVQIAALFAAGQLAAVPTAATVLMKGVMKAMFMRKLRLMAAGVMVTAALLGAVGFACRPATEALAQDKPDKPAPAGKDADQAPNVQASKPVSRAVADHKDFAGRTEARETVDLRCRLAGDLTKVMCKEGSSVNKGDLLFEVDPRPWQIEVDKATAEVRRAAANRTKAQVDLDRAKESLKAKTTSQADYESALTAVDVANAALMAVEAGLNKAKLDLESTRVTAPINGTIVKVPLSVGNYVNAGATTLATIASTNPMAVAFDIDERTFLDLQQSARDGKIKDFRDGKYPVQMALGHGDYKYEGVLYSVAPQADPTTGTVRARAFFPNADGRLIPGLFAGIRLATGPACKTLLIDPEAVWSDKDGTAVFVVNDKNVVERRSVTLGQPSDGLQVVKSGLESGDVVVVRELGPKGRVVPASGTIKLGMSVRPELVVMPGQAEKKP